MDQLFYNGRIYGLTTNDPNSNLAEAMLVRNGQIVALGSKEQLSNIAYRPQAVDLQGYFVCPGFTDAHVHFLGLGLSLQSIQLSGCSRQETLDLVWKKSQTIPAGQWITGRGFNFNDWPEGWPKKEWLDDVAPHHPVALSAKDGHLMWVNSKALKEVGITASTPNPPNGVIERNEAGELTGLLMEEAIPLINNHIPEPEVAQCQEALDLAIKVVHKNGITGVHTMEGALTLKSLQEYRNHNELNLRVWTALPANDLAHISKLGVQAGFGDRNLRIGGVKAFADGALGARTAWMLNPYEGTDNIGVPTLPTEELNQLVAKANGAGLPVVVHAIGDAASQAVLDAIENHGVKTLRNRIEHVQLLHENDIRRFAQLGVVASMQPTHCPADRYMADRYWGARCASAYPFRDLLAHRTTLAFGSDTPVEDSNVLVGLYSAVARKRWDEPASIPWYPEQTISMREALRGFTYGGAYAASEEKWRGQLAPQMVADFTVLSHDILAAEDPEILKETEIVATYIDGQCVYEK